MTRSISKMVSMQKAVVNVMLSPAFQRGRLREASMTRKPWRVKVCHCHGFFSRERTAVDDTLRVYDP